MATNFPNSPANGDTHTAAGTTYVYDATNSVWKRQGSSGGFDPASVSESLIPDANETYDLGSSTNKFRDLYLSGNSITLGTVELSDNGGALEVTPTGGGSAEPFATETYVTTQVANLVDAAPGALDTLNELAAALGDDANFSTTITNSIASKLPLAGGTLTGALSGTSATFSGAMNADSYGMAGAIQAITWTTNTLRLGQGTYWNNVELWDGSAIRLKVASGGNVGIGTTAPTQKLSVQGNTDLGNSYGSTTSSTYTTRVSGHAMRYDASNRYGNYGVLILNADSGWTASARRFMLTSGLDVNKFAIIRSVDATTDPSFGDGGVISSGTADFVIDMQDTVNGEMLTYTQGAGGARTVLEFPGLDTLIGKGYSINRAEIITHVLQGTASPYTLPNTLLILQDQDSAQALIKDYTSPVNPAGGAINRADLREFRYRFNVTRMVHDFVNEKEEVLPVILTPASSSSSAARVVLGGGLHPTIPVEFNVYYTKSE